MDNAIQWFARESYGRPGKQTDLNFRQPDFLAEIGAVEGDDAEWLIRTLIDNGLLQGSDLGDHDWHGTLTARGWERHEELRRAHVASRFAFFARKFDNPELDQVYGECLKSAVAETGYELRTVTQKAGLIDAVIEDEIRRCRFLIVDLSDDNAGAYWEAGLAEGLGKPVIYICRAKAADGGRKATHFDTNHRHTVRWALGSLDRTATELKAVIRNTLFDDASPPQAEG